MKRIPGVHHALAAAVLPILTKSAQADLVVGDAHRRFGYGGNPSIAAPTHCAQRECRGGEQ